MRAFRTGKVDVLVATDVAARGLDVDDVTHVVNYECPEDEKAYLHRIGRTGRAGRTGVAVTFVDWNDLSRWKIIDDVLHLDTPEPVETYSTSEHLYADLNIPAGAKGMLPRAQRERLGLEAEQLEDIGETGRTRSRSQPSRSGSRRGDSSRGSDRSTDRGPATADEGREPSARRPRVRRRLRSGVLTETGHDHASHEHAAAHDHAAGHDLAAGQPHEHAPAGEHARGHVTARTAEPASTTHAHDGPAPDQPSGDEPRTTASRPRRRRRRSSGQGQRAASDSAPTTSTADGSAANGSASNGSASNGSAANGTTPNGTASNSSAPKTSTADSA
jgi:superfamily II DNA/RNA helicase